MARSVRRMLPPRWVVGHLVALVELGCGLVAAIWFTVVGIDADQGGTAGRSTLDQAFPFLLAAAGLLVLGGMAARSWRAADREAGEPRRPPPGPDPAPQHPTPRPPPPASAPPSLSPQDRREVERVVGVLGRAGVFAPAAPDPAALVEAMADAGGPVTADVVLAALDEAAWYRPGFAPAAYRANLAFHDSHVEQFAQTLRHQFDDLVRLAAGGLAGVALTIELDESAGATRVPTRLTLRVDGASRVFEYAGTASYLSTVLHVALAAALRARGTGRRLAWLWSDQGAWLTGLPDDHVEHLNAALGGAAGEGWEWVDETEPVAAGDPYPPP